MRDCHKREDINMLGYTFWYYYFLSIEFFKRYWPVMLIILLIFISGFITGYMIH